MNFIEAKKRREKGGINVVDESFLSEHSDNSEGFSKTEIDVDIAWQVVRKLVKNYPELILFREWGTALQVNSYRSPVNTGISFIANCKELSEMRDRFRVIPPLKRDSEQKWRTNLSGVPINFHVAYQGRLGKVFGIPISNLIENTETIAGVKTLNKEGILVCHVAAILDEQNSLEIENEKNGAIALLTFSEEKWNWEMLRNIVSPYDNPSPERLEKCLQVLQDLNKEISGRSLWTINIAEKFKPPF